MQKLFADLCVYFSADSAVKTIGIDASLTQHDNKAKAREVERR